MMVVILSILGYFIYRFIHGDRPTDHQVNCVLSFGSRQGGFAFAEKLKELIVGQVGWQPTAVYLDRDGLTGKAGTAETAFVDDLGKKQTAQLNPSWATYYQSAMEEAPARLHANPSATTRNDPFLA